MSWTSTPQVNSEGQVVGFDTQQQHEGYGRFSADDFTVDDYWNDVISLEPDIPNAIQWAADHLSPEFIADFNAALDADNRDEVNQYLEMILNDYRESYGSEAVEEEEVDYDEELTPEEQQILDDVVDNLQGAEAMGEEAADEWQQAVYQAQASGDEVYAAVAAATSSFHSGEVTAEEAIGFILNNYPLKEVARVYEALNG
jgi:hypothetical protein